MFAASLFHNEAFILELIAILAFSFYVIFTHQDIDL